MPQAPLLETLVAIVPDLDRLIADMEMGRPSQTRHDGHSDQAVRLAERILVAARGPGRSINPPIGRTAAGGYVW